MNRSALNASSQRSMNYFEQDAFHSYSNSFDHLSNPLDFENFIRAASLGDLKGVCNYLNKVYCRVDEESNMDSNHRGWTALMYAAHYGHYDIVKALLEKRANANHRDANGTTPLMCSAQNGHTRCIEMLVGQGKADIRLRDKSNFTAAYYATHYGHGNNKIIAKLLKIPNQSNGYGSFNGSPQSNHRANRDHHHHFVSSNANTSSCSSGDRTFLSAASQSNSQKSPTGVLNFQNASFSDEALSYYSFNNSSTNQSFGEVRRAFGDAQQARNQATNGNCSNDVSDLLNRKQPRAIFKQRPRRSSPNSVQQLTIDLNNNNNLNGNLNNNLNGNLNEHMLTQSFVSQNGANKESKQSRCHSFGSANLMMLSPAGLPNGVAQRSGSLTLDLNPNYHHKSPPSSAPASNFSPDQGYSSWPKQNIFVYDDLPAFNSPKSPAENQSFDEHQTSKQDISGPFNPNSSWQDSDLPIESRNKPRNSTFVSSDHSNFNLPERISPSSQPASIESPSLDYKFADLAQNLSELLHELGLQKLADKFAEKRIDLYTFLTMSEDDLKAIGITDFEQLATLIAKQFKFREQIGIESSEAMRYVAYLGANLENAKTELSNLKNELKMYQMGLHDIDIKGKNRTPNGYPGSNY